MILCFLFGNHKSYIASGSISKFWRNCISCHFYIMSMSLTTLYDGIVVFAHGCETESSMWKINFYSRTYK